jgi:nitrogen fixation NifU-like protein
MDELRELYQQVILDHNKNPRNFGKLEGANRQQEGFNPLCGDHLHVYLQVDDDDVIEDIRFEGAGCAISKASASLMTDAVKGRSSAEAEAVFERFQALVTSDVETPVDQAQVGKLAVFAGVREFPMRVKCATLAWHTMRSALNQQVVPTTTE